MNRVMNIIKEHLYLIVVGLSFFFIDIIIRFLNVNTGFRRFFSFSPNIFTISWILIFIGIILLLNRKLQIITYIVFITFFSLYLIINYIYLMIFNTFFSIKSLQIAGEGMNYFSIIFEYINKYSVIVFFIILLMIFSTIKLIPINVNKNYKKGFTIIFIGIFLNIFAHFTLGSLASNDVWDAWNYRANIYKDFTELKKAMNVSGIYEYLFRDISLTLFSEEKLNSDEAIKYLDNFFINYQNQSTNNEFLNGSLKDKNLIIVLMEGMDNWLISDQNTPTLKKLMNEGINFTKHYSVMYSDGATYNSEFMINTGYMTPINGWLVSQYYKDNNYKYSLANIFKDNGYVANEYHFNTGDFYNRGVMSKSLGYSNYYSALEMGYNNAILDSFLIREKEFANLLTPDSKFLDFIITYSGHAPYTFTSPICSLLLDKNKYDFNNKNMSETDICINYQAKETDDFFKLLLEHLESKAILDDTIIIGVTDHYTYGYPDKKQLSIYENTDNPDLMSNVPFFIWGNGIKNATIDKVNSNLDVLPTIMYLFGFESYNKYYLGSNIFDENYDGFAFFKDYSWITDDIYYKNGEFISQKILPIDTVNKYNKKINDIIEINEKVLKYDYFNLLK